MIGCGFVVGVVVGAVVGAAGLGDGVLISGTTSSVRSFGSSSSGDVYKRQPTVCPKTISVSCSPSFIYRQDGTCLLYTSGEPMIAKNIDVLLERLSREESLEVEIETNGSVSLTAFRQMKRPPSFTIDYKLAGSGIETKMCMDNFAEVVKQDTVKFVVSGRSDLERA